MQRLLATVLLLASCASPVASTVPADSIDFSAWQVQDYDGVSHDLSSQLSMGEPVVLVFWQTWCLSCLAEAPALSLAARQHSGLHFYGVISGDAETVDEAEVRKIAFQKTLPYPQVLDRDLGLTEAFGITGTPTIVVVGPGGEILHRGHSADVDWGGIDS